MWQVDGAACSLEPPTRDGFDGSLDSRPCVVRCEHMGARELYACISGVRCGPGGRRASGVLGRCWVLVVLVTSALCFN